jgi:hypothetical protein
MFQYDPYTSKNTFINLEWSLIDGEQYGGEVLGYEVYVWIEDAWVTYDQDSITSTTSITGLTGGVTYLFKIGAYNKYGVGEIMPSPELTIVAAQEPDVPIDVLVVVSGNYALISWTAPFDNNSAITGYYVYVENNWDDGS